MTDEQKIALIGEVLEINQDELNSEIRLEDLQNWDSVAVLSLIIMLKKNGFNQKLDASKISNLKTIQNIFDLMV